MGRLVFLVLCQFERAVSGISINSVLKDLEELGYSAVALNSKLELLGLEKECPQETGSTFCMRCWSTQ